MEKYALFTYESLKKTKCREFVPSRDEIEALISRQEMTSTVYCHGGGSCKITINSHTTAGEVRVVTEQLWHKISVSLYIPIPDSSVSTKLRKHSGLLYRSLLSGEGAVLQSLSVFGRNPCYINCPYSAENYRTVVPSYRKNCRKN